jgi:hypothetical protein
LNIIIQVQLSDSFQIKSLKIINNYTY